MDNTIASIANITEKLKLLHDRNLSDLNGEKYAQRSININAAKINMGHPASYCRILLIASRLTPYLH